MSDRIVVYTAIYNKYDQLKNPVHVDKNVKYVCFTDNPDLKSTIWDIRYLPPMVDRMDKYLKLFPTTLFPDYDISIWVDGSVRIRKNISDLVNYLNGNDMAVFRHPRGNTLREEFKVCIRNKKADEEALIKQRIRYQNYLDIDVVACGVLIRRHHAVEIQKFMVEWWIEQQKTTYRDQLSFPVIAEMYKYKYTVIDNNIFNNRYLSVVKKHRK